MMNPGVIARLRRACDAVGYFPDRCTIQSVSYANSARGRVKTYSTSAEDVRCRIAPVTQRTPDESIVAGKVQGKTLYTITLPHDTVLQNDWRIVIDGGDTFEVLGTQEGGAWTIALRAVCEKVAQED